MEQESEFKPEITEVKEEDLWIKDSNGNIVGVCYYCKSSKDISDWYFSCEFDCYLHEDCLNDAIRDYKGNDRELKLIAKEIYDKDI